MPKKLLSKEEHDAMKRIGYDFKVNTGVACPNCGAELIYSDPNTVLTATPPQKSVRCLDCGHRDFILA